MKSLFLPALALAFLCLPVSAQPNKPGNISGAQKPASPAKSIDAGDKTGNISPDNSLKLTEAERKALEPLQAAAIEANQELVAAADALDAAKPADVLAAAWRWKAAVTAFKAALANRGNWISATAKAKGCDGCELNLQAMEFQKAKQ